jgi:hypothetical protein
MTSLTPALEALVATLGPVDQLNFFTFWEGIYQARFTGNISVDCLNGVPRQIGIGRPLILTLVQPLPQALDTDKDPVAG